MANILGRNRRGLVTPEVLMLHAEGLRLGKRELEIMNVVWDLGKATVQDVCDRLVRPAAYSTVLTMMRTLESKGLLTHRMRQRTFVYHPAIARDEVRTSMLVFLRDLLFGGSTSLVVNTLLSRSSMKPEQLAELRRLLDKLKEL